ncbi:MAG: bile acid:sodium symporter family protein [Planctomycetaceae bacterium]|nr:bile acid:sodium symporter family protein [Planctomycetaceae bacterium]
MQLEQLDKTKVQTSRLSPLEAAFRWYTKLFAFWIVLFALIGYFYPRPFVFLGTVKMFGRSADNWPQILQSIRSPNLWFFALTMFGIGAVLTVDDFKNIIRRPIIVLIGTLAQFIIMPFGAYLLTKIFNLDPMLAAGLIIAGCAPGAMSSNVMSYIAKADVAYSVSLTTVSTLLCPIVTPALTKLLAGQDLPVSFWNMFFEIIFMVILPLAAGFAVRLCFGRLVERVKEIFPAISVTFIIFVCTLVIASNREAMLQASGLIILVVLLLNLGGLAGGYGVATFFKMPDSQRRTLAIEVGMQNAGLGTVLAIHNLGPRAAIPTAFFVFTCIITASLLTAYWKSRRTEVITGKI